MQASSEPAIARPGMAPVVLVLALSVLFPVRDAAAAQPRDHEQAFQTHPFFVAYSTGLFDPRGAPAGTSGKAAGAAAVAAGSCGRDLREFWKPGEFLVNGASHWLVRVFTIDLDGDGRVDNLGFRLRPREGPDLLPRHFEPPGTRGLAALPGLEPAAEVEGVTAPWHETQSRSHPPPAAGRRRDSSLDGGGSFGHHA